MLVYLTLIFCCQLVGEFIVTASGLPVPGPVVGMALLFIGLLIHGAIPEGLGVTADALISHLSLLFVPAGVGIMLHAKLIGAEFIPISLALIISTLLTIAVTAILMSWLNPKPTGDHGQTNQKDQ